MRPEHIHFLRCPESGLSLELKNAQFDKGRIREGILLEPTSGREYSITNFIPRFVPSTNYADNFGLEWNLHKRTQYDETSGFSISAQRFRDETKWGPDLSGETILEVGCGSGRFTKHAVETGAKVVSLDYSNAVEANHHSNGEKDNLLIVQANVYRMPFAKSSFDKAFCFGVLQHTPDPRSAFLNILECLKAGGRIASDIYVKDLIHWLLQTKYLIRPFTRGKNPEKLYGFTKRYVDLLWPLARQLRRIPRVGYAINWRLLVADYSKVLPDADDETLKEWAYLDTFDMLSPMYDFPQTLKTFKRWHEEAGLTDIDVHYGYNGIEGRATKPLRS